MNVGIITYHRTINYGAVLQVYALQKVLQDDMCCHVEIIDYSPVKIGAIGDSYIRLVRHIVWANVFRRILVGLEREKRTDNFINKYLQLSLKRYSHINELTLSYDAYITGSDQVWNPFINNNDAVYFLDFVPREKRRISYAASFGISKIPDKFVADYCSRLKNIDFLSVREDNGVELIKQLTGRVAKHVLDPTLLLTKEQWNNIAIPSTIPEKYILCYYMPGEKATDKYLTKIANLIANLTGWKIINIGMKEYMKLDTRKYTIFNAGPLEFLGLMQKASFVVTNSFHGVVFSINYRKPFLVPVNKNISMEKKLTSRIISLLRKMCLEDRLCFLEQDLSIKNDVLHINYELVEEKLRLEREKSFFFLKSSLEGL